MSLRIRPPINASDEWFDEVERVFDSKLNDAAKSSTSMPVDRPVPADPNMIPPLEGRPAPVAPATPASPAPPGGSKKYVFRRPGYPMSAKFRRKTAVRSSASLQDYGERLVKLIPSEVVGIYLVGVGVIPAAAKISVTVWAIVCLALVVLARAYATKEPALNLPPQWKAVVISSVSFVIWVYTIPGPFQSFGLAVPYIGSLAILVWTFVVPYFYTGA